MLHYSFTSFVSLLPSSTWCKHSYGKTYFLRILVKNFSQIDMKVAHMVKNIFENFGKKYLTRTRFLQFRDCPQCNQFQTQNDSFHFSFFWEKIPFWKRQRNFLSSICIIPYVNLNDVLLGGLVLLSNIGFSYRPIEVFISSKGFPYQ